MQGDEEEFKSFIKGQESTRKHHGEQRMREWSPEESVQQQEQKKQKEKEEIRQIRRQIEGAKGFEFPEEIAESRGKVQHSNRKYGGTLVRRRMVKGKSISIPTEKKVKKEEVEKIRQQISGAKGFTFPDGVELLGEGSGQREEDANGMF